MIKHYLKILLRNYIYEEYYQVHHQETSYCINQLIYRYEVAGVVAVSMKFFLK